MARVMWEAALNSLLTLWEDRMHILDSRLSLVSCMLAIEVAHDLPQYLVSATLKQYLYFIVY